MSLYPWYFGRKSYLAVFTFAMSRGRDQAGTEWKGKVLRLPLSSFTCSTNSHSWGEGITIWRPYILCIKSQRWGSCLRIPTRDPCDVNQCRSLWWHLVTQGLKGPSWAKLQARLCGSVALLYTRRTRSTPRAQHTVLICPVALYMPVSVPGEPLSLKKADWLYITSQCARRMPRILFASAGLWIWPWNRQASEVSMSTTCETVSSTI